MLLHEAIPTSPHKYFKRGPAISLVPRSAGFSNPGTATKLNNFLKICCAQSYLVDKRFTRPTPSRFAMPRAALLSLATIPNDAELE